MLKSWDKFVIPKPFSRSIIHMDKPVYVPPELNDKEFEDFRILMEQKLTDNKKEIETIWRDKARVKDIFKNNLKT